ncbi:MAG TPA: L-seryl-tRNA(Sec) selenium transferase [Candidatus Acidoferrales bacterium]|nr:L-seryl-tRNA(Sec) selenium transferase [Candidatus Acidoferrales bacterium]
MGKNQAGLQRIPSLDALLIRPEIATLSARFSREFVVQIGRDVLADLRAGLSARGESGDMPDANAIASRMIAAVERAASPSLQPVINATGVVLHTNLGRAPMALAAAERIRATATLYSNLEFDLASGGRGKRDVHTSRLIARLVGAESALVVNNNAAAVYLVLAALSRGGEAIVSRGELIEIGDGFRIPDIMAESGAILREVGTTNRTRLADYERALNERTRLILRVHRSNFRVVGFAAQPLLKELAGLARKAKVPLYEDLGSGCLVDLHEYGIDEPVVHESFQAGADIVSFSGDKLLGGPQAGIIAGESELTARIRRHPMFRALRVDKLTIASLEASLLEYLRAPQGVSAIPTIRMIQEPAAEVARRCERVVRALKQKMEMAKIGTGSPEIEIIESTAIVGGGSTPGQSIPSYAIAIRGAGISSADFETRLREGPKGIPIVARVEKNRVILDLRTVFPEQETVLIDSLVAVMTS